MNKALIKQWGIPFVMGLLGGCVVLMLWLTLFTPKPKPIVTLDIVGITQQFIDQQLKASKGQSDQMQKVSRFSRQIDNLVKQMAYQRHVIVVPRQAVIAGGIDMTEQVKKILFKPDMLPHKEKQ